MQCKRDVVAAVGKLFDNEVPMTCTDDSRASPNPPDSDREDLLEEHGDLLSLPAIASTRIIVIL